MQLCLKMFFLLVISYAERETAIIVGGRKKVYGVVPLTSRIEHEAALRVQLDLTFVRIRWVLLIRSSASDSGSSGSCSM